MARRVIWSQKARDQLQIIFLQIKQDDPEAARRWRERIVQAARSLDELSERGRVVPELGAPDIHELILGNYRLVHRVEAKRIVVLTIRHVCRDPDTFRL
ncbi:type II toxin-antitoxin system RelE/ParE family toxin [bacterium CPR1]|nr:type II toxin-antitoxin system RelE/ParE family toxin [bacterium CPR1]